MRFSFSKESNTIVVLRQQLSSTPTYFQFQKRAWFLVPMWTLFKRLWTVAEAESVKEYCTSHRPENREDTHATSSRGKAMPWEQIQSHTFCLLNSIPRALVLVVHETFCQIVLVSQTPVRWSIYLDLAGNEKRWDMINFSMRFRSSVSQSLIHLLLLELEEMSHS